MRRFLPVSSAFLHQGERICTQRHDRAGRANGAGSPSTQRSVARRRIGRKQGAKQDARPGARRRRAVGKRRPARACGHARREVRPVERAFREAAGRRRPGCPLHPALRYPSTRQARSARRSPTASARAATSAATPARRCRGSYSCRVHGRKPCGRIRECSSAGIATE
jgi:hypothetical protein